MDEFLNEIVSFMSVPPTEGSNTQPLPTNGANNPSIIYRDFLPINPRTSHDRPRQTTVSGPVTRSPVLAPPATTLSLNVGPITAPPQPRLRSRKPTSRNGSLSQDNRYKRIMRNREAAIRARERKQNYITYLEEDIAKLTEENAILRRAKLEMEKVAAVQRPKKSTLHRTSSALF